MTVKIKKDSDSEENNVVYKVIIGDKEYTADDVQNLLDQQESATKKTQKVAAILSAAQKYGVDVETYLSQAEGAFDVLGRLIKAKVIDEKGNVVEKKEEPSASGKENPQPADDDLMKLFNIEPSGDSKSLTGADKIAAIALKALEPTVGEIKKIAERVGAIDKTQSEMIRLQLQERILEKFPKLTANDVSQVFASAMNDKSKDLWQHADEKNKVKLAELDGIRKEHAKEFGVDLEKFDENKLKEQNADGGAGALFKGKTFSFNASEGDENVVDPSKAASEYIERSLASSES